MTYHKRKGWGADWVMDYKKPVASMTKDEVNNMTLETNLIADRVMQQYGNRGAAFIGLLSDTLRERAQKLMPAPAPQAPAVFGE